MSLNKPDIEYKFGLAGKYKFVAKKLDEAGNVISERLLADWFDNLITDAALDDIGKASGRGSWLNGGYTQVGTGNTPPTTSDTSLANYLAETNIPSGGGQGVFLTAQLTTQPYYHKLSITRRFATGAAAGNLTEVAVWPGNHSVMISRALIKDSNGNPTTITVLSDEVLDVSYELYIYLPNGGSPVTGSFSQTILGTPTTYTYTLLPAGAANVDLTFGYWKYGTLWSSSAIAITGSSSFPSGLSPNPIVGITGIPSSTGAVGNPSSGTRDAYVNGNHYVDLTMPFGLGEGNITWQTYCINVDGFGMFQMQISPTITKNNTQTYYVKIRFSWGRYTP